MEQNATYFKIGLFILIGLAAGIGGILYINADVVRGQAVLVETYIDESVQGLGVGSSVLYRGVTIGQVKDITFVPRVYSLSPDALDQFGRYVLVLMAIQSDLFPGISGDPDDMANVIQRQIQSGLRFKLSYQGITGIVYMEADYVTNPKEPLELPWQPQHLYVPSTPSLVTSFTAAIDRLFRRLEELDVQAIFTKLEKLLDTTTQTFEDAKIAEVRENFMSLIDEFKASNQQVRAWLEKADELPADLSSTLQQFEQTLMQVETLIQRNEPDFENVLADLRDLLRNLKQFSEDLKTDPAQLLFSQPPKPSEKVQ
jgi:phospholipid/cholesterol/gamma-HCH transport system substrate-binding protein